MRMPGMRIFGSALLAGALALAACGPQPGEGVDSSGKGAPAPLVYAAAGTAIVLANTVADQRTESSITAGVPSGPRGAFIRPDGSEGAFYPGCWDCGGAMQVDEAAYAALWPLETGKSTSFVRTAPDGSKARIVISVAGTEVIETPAGRFQTYVLDGQTVHLTGARYSANVRAWWAPDPGWVVRAEGRDSTGIARASEVTALTGP